MAKKVSTKYSDGTYQVINKDSVVTDVKIKQCLVYIVGGGLGDGRTGMIAEELESHGIRFCPVLAS